MLRAAQPPNGRVEALGQRRVGVRLLARCAKTCPTAGCCAVTRRSPAAQRPNGPTAMARARCDSCMEGNMYVVSRGEVSCGFGLGFCVSFASRPRQQINLGTSFPCVPPRFTAAPFHIPPYYFTSLYCRRQRCGFASNPVEFLNGRSSSISAGPREYSASSAYGTLLIKRVHGTFIALGLRQLIPCFF